MGDCYSHYSILPQLRKITVAGIFEPTTNPALYLAAKANARLSQQCFFEQDCSPETYGAVCDFAAAFHPLRPAGTFAEIAESIPEDLIIHRLSDDSDWMAAGHISFPSGWWPEKKIGRTFAEIHDPIPGFRSSRSLVESMVYCGPFERFVWSVIFDDDLNHHPSRPQKGFDHCNPTVNVKVERQTIVGFPEQRAALFVLRQYVVRDPNRIVLADSIAKMTIEQLDYKGLLGCRDALLSHLRG